MRIKLILVGIASTIFGIFGIFLSLNNLAQCNLASLGGFRFPVYIAVDCDSTNYSDGTLGVFFIIGIVLIIAGFMKKSVEAPSNAKQESNS